MATSCCKSCDLVQHSQTSMTVQPRASSSSTVLSSRNLLPSSFGRQKSSFVFGIRASLQFGSGCRCQKHPCTNSAMPRRRKTRSGFPGRSFACNDIAIRLREALAVRAFPVWCFAPLCGTSALFWPNPLHSSSTTPASSGSGPATFSPTGAMSGTTATPSS